MPEEMKITLELASGTRTLNFPNYDPLGNPMSILELQYGGDVFVTYVWNDLPPEEDPHYEAVVKDERGDTMYELKAYDKQGFAKTLAGILDIIDRPKHDELSYQLAPNGQNETVLTTNRPATLREVLKIIENFSAGAKAWTAYVLDQDDDFRLSVGRWNGRPPTSSRDKREIGSVMRSRVTDARYTVSNKQLNWKIKVSVKNYDE